MTINSHVLFTISRLGRSLKTQDDIPRVLWPMPLPHLKNILSISFCSPLRTNGYSPLVTTDHFSLCFPRVAKICTAIQESIYFASLTMKNSQISKKNTVFHLSIAALQLFPVPRPPHYNGVFEGLRHFKIKLWRQGGKVIINVLFLKWRFFSYFLFFTSDISAEYIFLTARLPLHASKSKASIIESPTSTWRFAWGRAISKNGEQWGNRQAGCKPAYFANNCFFHGHRVVQLLGTQRHDLVAVQEA